MFHFLLSIPPAIAAMKTQLTGVGSNVQTIKSDVTTIKTDVQAIKPAVLSTESLTVIYGGRPDVLQYLLATPTPTSAQVQSWLGTSANRNAFRATIRAPHAAMLIANTEALMDILVGSNRARADILADAYMMSVCVSSRPAMRAIAKSATTMQAITSDADLMQAVFSTYTAREAMFNSAAAVQSLLTTGRTWMNSNVRTTEWVELGDGFETLAFANGKNILLLSVEGIHTSPSRYWEFKHLAHGYSWTDPNKNLDAGSSQPANIPLTNPTCRGVGASSLIRIRRYLNYVVMEA